MMKNNSWNNFFVGFAGCLFLELAIVEYSIHIDKARQKDTMYVSSPKDVIENWTKPAYFAGFLDGKHQDKAIIEEQYHIWFENQYEIAYNKMIERR